MYIYSKQIHAEGKSEMVQFRKEVDWLFLDYLLNSCRRKLRLVFVIPVRLNNRSDSNQGVLDFYMKIWDPRFLDFDHVVMFIVPGKCT